MRPLLYIHGFASSGHSHKAAVLRAHFTRVLTPSLPTVPTLAVETLNELIDALPETPLLIGSSLGGFYAAHLAAARSLPAVLVNPALEPARVLRQALGLNRHYYDGSGFELTEQHLESLAAMAFTPAAHERILLLLQMGDELLDHNRTLELLPGARAITEPGGDHGFRGFERHIETIADFAATAA